jgi:hypothetical protein
MFLVQAIQPEDLVGVSRLKSFRQKPRRTVEIGFEDFPSLDLERAVLFCTLFSDWAWRISITFSPMASRYETFFFLGYREKKCQGRDVLEICR